MPGGRHEHMQAWSPEEDHIIIDGVQLHGHQWRLIVKQLPGRSVSSTRNRFNRIEKGRQLQEQGKRGRNLCHYCWQPKRGHICTKKLNGGPHVVNQTIVVRQNTTVVTMPQMQLGPAPAPAPAPLPMLTLTAAAAPNAWPKPTVQRSSSMLSVLGSEDISELFGQLARSDVAAQGAESPLIPAAEAPPPPAAPPLPVAVDEQQLEAGAPPALLRLASGDAQSAASSGWVPPMLSRSLSSFFKGASFLLPDGPDGGGEMGGAGGGAGGGAASASAGGSFLDEEMGSLVSVSKSSSEASVAAGHGPCAPEYLRSLSLSGGAEVLPSRCLNEQSDASSEASASLSADL